MSDFEKLFEMEEQENENERVLDDFQLERYCDNNPDCGCKCISCPFMAMNMRYHELYG